MNRLLLDTHLLLWSLIEPAKLPPRARARIHAGEVYVSAASIWEISIKSALGKLKVDPEAVCGVLAATGFRALSVTAEHAARVHRLPPLHRDPFDRMLIAQASSEQLTLVTNDAALLAYGPIVETV